MVGERANVRTVTEALPQLCLAEEACRDLGMAGEAERCADLRRRLAARVMMKTGDGGEDFQRAQEAFRGYGGDR